jgi:hypothetical protein
MIKIFILEHLNIINIILLYSLEQQHKKENNNNGADHSIYHFVI